MPALIYRLGMKVGTVPPKDSFLNLGLFLNRYLGHD